MSRARHLLSLAASLTLASGAASARAQIGSTGSAPARTTTNEKELTDLPEDARVLPRGPTIPDLQHTAAEASLEQTIASVKPKAGGGVGGVPTDDAALTSHLFEADFEIPVVRQTVYVGGQYAFAAARSPAQHEARFVSGQPEIFGRIAHGGPDESWAIGAGLGFMAPLVTYDDLDDAKRVQTATTSALVGIVRPWDLSMFFDRRVTARPWLDLRVGRHKFIVQLRQGLDVAMRSGVPSGASANAAFAGKVGDIEMISITALYIGWQPTPELALGVEAWDVYLLKTQLPVGDRDRTVFALSPGFRMFYKWVEPGVSLLLPIGAPLLGAVDNYVALRIDLRVWFDR
jgi:hypothetical protein